MDNLNEELYHWGIKGMKWGIRRFQNKDGSLTSAGRKRRKGDSSDESVKSKESKESKSKSVKDMTDDELRAKINRMQMEKQYNDLMPKKVSVGKKFTERVLNNVILPAGEDVAKQLVKSGMTKTVNDLFKLDDELKVHTNNKKK